MGASPVCFSSAWFRPLPASINGIKAPDCSFYIWGFATPALTFADQETKAFIEWNETIGIHMNVPCSRRVSVSARKKKAN